MEWNEMLTKSNEIERNGDKVERNEIEQNEMVTKSNETKLPSNEMELLSDGMKWSLDGMTTNIGWNKIVKERKLDENPIKVERTSIEQDVDSDVIRTSTVTSTDSQLHRPTTWCVVAWQSVTRQLMTQ